MEGIKIVLVRGVGRHKEKLQSFELALRDADISQFNLVRVSSIFPPKANLAKKEALLEMNAGDIVHCVLSDNATNEPHRLIAASVGLAIPNDSSKHGYLSEAHDFGKTEDEAGDYAEDLAAEMLATILGIPFDADKAWNERVGTWVLNEGIVKTKNITQSALGQRGVWTTVVAGAIFVPSKKIVPVDSTIGFVPANN